MRTIERESVGRAAWRALTVGKGAKHTWRTAGGLVHSTQRHPGVVKAERRAANKRARAARRAGR